MLFYEVATAWLARMFIWNWTGNLRRSWVRTAECHIRPVWSVQIRSVVKSVKTPC